MPEGPEVSYMVYHLNKLFKHCLLTNMLITGGRYKTSKFPDNYTKFQKVLPLEIDEIYVKGKLIWFTFVDSEFIMMITLGLTGHFVWDKNHGRKHLHYEFHTKKNDKEKTFYLDDANGLGSIEFIDNPTRIKQRLKTRQNDMLHEDLSDDDFLKIFDRLRKKDIMIAKLLMKQQYFAGIGNYIRAEALYDAQIDPHRLVKDMTDDDKLSLKKSIEKILHNSYKKQLKDGLHTYKFKVYNQSVDPLGNPVTGETLEPKRTIWWVPNIQK